MIGDGESDRPAPWLAIARYDLAGAGALSGGTATLLPLATIRFRRMDLSGLRTGPFGSIVGIA